MILAKGNPDDRQENIRAKTETKRQRKILKLTTSGLFSVCHAPADILFLPLEHKIHIFSPPCNIPSRFSKV